MEIARGGAEAMKQRVTIRLKKTLKASGAIPLRPCARAADADIKQRCGDPGPRRYGPVSGGPQ
jgi:hypothetical protein